VRTGEHPWAARHEYFVILREELKRWSQLGLEYVEIGYRLLYAVFGDMYNEQTHRLTKAKLAVAVLRSSELFVGFAVFLIVYFLEGLTTDFVRAITRSAYALVTASVTIFSLEFLIGQKLEALRTKILVPYLPKLLKGLVSQKSLNILIQGTLRDLEHT